MEHLIEYLIGPAFIVLASIFGKFFIGKIFQILEEIKKDIVILMDHLDAGKTKSHFKLKLNKVNAHYVDTFSIKMFENCARFKGDKFVTIISKIIDTYDVMDINVFPNIINDLENGACIVEEHFIEHLGSELTDKFYSQHIYQYEVFKNDIEEILLDINNHYPERIIKLSISFLRSFMKELLELEKEFCKE